MKINIPTPAPAVIPEYTTGHVYRKDDGALYIAAVNGALVNLRTGTTYAGLRKFGSEPERFTDMGHISKFITD